MKSEAQIAKERWPILFKMIRVSFPRGSIRVIDKGRENRHWKVGLEEKKDDLAQGLFLKIRHKVMTHPEADYESRFLEALEEAHRIFSLSASSMEFLGTIFVDTEGVVYHEGENLDDNWF